MFEFGPLWLVSAGTGAATFGPAWAGLMAALGVGGVLAGRIRFDSVGSLGTIVGLLVGASATLVFGHHPLLVTGAQVVLVVLAVAVGIHLTRLLHDAVASDVRSGVASGIGAASWLVFLPFALAFGSASERWGVNAAGWLLVGVAVAAAALLILVAASAHRSRSGAPAEAVVLEADHGIEVDADLAFERVAA